MTDDLKALAAETMCDAFDAMPDDAHRPPPRVTATTVMPPPEPPCPSCLATTDAVLAAVLPAHRRQVLAEAADSLQPDLAGRWSQMADDAEWLAAWLTAHGLSATAGPGLVIRAVARDFQAWATTQRGRAPARIDGAGRTGAGAGDRVDDAQSDSGGRDG